MKVRHWMTPDPESCRVTTDLAAIAMTMWRRDCGVVPVLDATGETVVGVITDRDICMALATRHCRASDLTAADVMSGTLHKVAPEQDVRVALDLMRTQRVRRLPVVSRDGRLVGLLSLHDMVRHSEPARGRARTAPSTEDVFEVMRAIGTPHVTPAAREREEELVG